MTCKQLTQEQRYHIAALKGEGYTQTAIAKRVGSSPCTISREFAHHEKVAEALDCGYYFAHPYTSWEHGLNANTNGLVRQFFTRGSSFEGIKDKVVNSVKHLLNRRPRKTLDYATPQEEFFKNLFGVNCALQG